MKKPFKWDSYSDQPYQLKDKLFKKKMRKKESFSLIKTFLVALIILPISIVMTPFVRRKSISSSDFFSLGAEYQRDVQTNIDSIKDLNPERVLLRLKLWEMDTLSELEDFIKKIDKKITLKILQDRENIQDSKLLNYNLDLIFSKFQSSVDMFEIGSTINRAKWGFFSVNEYANFYKVAYDLQQNKYKNIKLIGSGVIDFEYHFSIHTLFNLIKYKFNGVSSLLYVDRRGAPENMQMGFALADKIALLNTIVWLSPKSSNELHITETNWPISNTAPFAPTSEHECVSEDIYADFMLRYHLLAFASQQVDSLSWHQLVAPGYGLIDNRQDIRKRSAYNTYKFMLQNLKNAQFLRMDIKRGYYNLQFLVDEILIQIHWSLKEDTTLKKEDYFTVYSRDGEIINDDILQIGSSPIYIYINKAV
jgi:hypothetical protein